VRVGILVDAACDLPAEFIRDHDIQIVPNPVLLGSAQILDTRDPTRTDDFYKHAFSAHSGSALVAPIDTEALRDYIVQNMSLRYDHVILVTLGASFGDSHRLARQGTSEVARLSVVGRYDHKIKDLLQVNVVDSGNMFAGQGAQIIKLVELLSDGREPDALRSAFNEIVARTTSFFVPETLRGLYTQPRGDFDPTATSTNGFLGYAFGSILKLLPVMRVRHGISETWHKVKHQEAGIEKVADLLDSALRAGTIEPMLNVSYAGTLRDLGEHLGYLSLRKRIKAAGATIHESQMSFTGALRLGPGAIGFGVVASAKPR
jgi:fatty acid-binding protein DegV